VKRWAFKHNLNLCGVALLLVVLLGINFFIAKTVLTVLMTDVLKSAGGFEDSMKRAQYLALLLAFLIPASGAYFNRLWESAAFFGLSAVAVDVVFRLLGKEDYFVLCSLGALVFNVGFILFLPMLYHVLRTIYQLGDSLRIAELSNTKVNLLALISHNLNTPIAKMRGLYDILRPGLEAKKKCKKDFAVLDREIATLQLCLKSVLIGSRLSENTKNESRTFLLNFLDEFHSSMGALIAKIDKSFEIELEGEDERISFNIDGPAIFHLVACLIALPNPQYGAAELKNRIVLRLSEDAEGGRNWNQYQLEIQYYSLRSDDEVRDLISMALKSRDVLSDSTDNGRFDGCYLAQITAFLLAGIVRKYEGQLTRDSCSAAPLTRLSLVLNVTA
jgi:signal transduction histidine kinase